MGIWNSFVEIIIRGRQLKKVFEFENWFQEIVTPKVESPHDFSSSLNLEAQGSLEQRT